MSGAIDKVYLHIGHGKTGTSYIQSSLALSRERLIEKGIQYPIDPRASRWAEIGHSSTGNVSRLPFERLLPHTDMHFNGSLLLSSEFLFRRSQMGRNSHCVFDIVDEIRRLDIDPKFSILLAPIYMLDPTSLSTYI